MEKTGLLGKIIMAAILMILGAVLVSIVADASYGKTIKSSVSGLSEYHPMVIAGYPAINTTAKYQVSNIPTTDCALTNFAVTNSSGSALTLTSDYTVDLSTGIYSLKNTVNTNTTLGLYGPRNVTYVSYDYCGEGYVTGWGGNILNMVGGFLALMLFAAAVAVMYSIYKEVA